MSRTAICEMRDAPHVQDCGAVHFLAGELVRSSIPKLFIVVGHVINSHFGWLYADGERLVISFGANVLRQDAWSNESPGRARSKYYSGLQGDRPPDRHQCGLGTGLLEGSR